MHYTQVYNNTPLPPELVERLTAMPKVECHVHLEGATPAEGIFRLAQRNHVALPAPTLDALRAFYEFRDFNHFIEIYVLAVSAMKTADDFAEIAEDFLRRQAAQHILYSEVYFSPALHRQTMPAGEFLAALAEGIRRGEARYDTRIKLIMDISRELTSDATMPTFVLDCALQARDLGIGLGLGVGGPEIGYPAHLYREVFAEARRQGLRVVAHGGETDGAPSVRDAIESLHAERIGHGIRSLDDPLLVTELRERQLPIEVSPQSNYCIKVVPLDQPHPIRKMVDAGLFVTLNSDDPPMFSTDLVNEYLTLAAQGFTFEELWQLNLNGLDSSFLTDAEKAEMRRHFETFVQA